ncbi:hypothetical protein [Sphingomonas koreensis]|nr:hypothetical protein [Sphingomonas koreensis]MDC7808769.1 hypothetical protein [Sphingomonas koreensis]RSX17519.1 hypothetical protein DAH96_17070 [Sphingomonas koreensis]RSY96866.1 hypothetical protein DAH61_15625 [Sphingomonas koreensis]
MLKQRLDAAQTIRASFIKTETMIDAAAISATDCAARMLNARAEVRLPINVGLEAMAKVAEAASLAVRARQLILEAHPLMAEIPAEIGLGRVTGFGGTEDCPELAKPMGAHEVTPQPQEPLRIAA